MNVEPNAVVEYLARQIAAQAVEIAVLKAGNDALQATLDAAREQTAETDGDA